MGTYRIAVVKIWACLLRANVQYAQFGVSWEYIGSCINAQPRYGRVLTHNNERRQSS
jgi:hypothetical protein